MNRFREAEEEFDIALQMAMSQSDTTNEHIARGLLILTDAIRAKLTNMESHIRSVESKIR